MAITNWDEIRTAFHVARIGTVSGAASVLGVHHATVIRHIDALERQMGTRLFQRHARGYTATEAGADLLRVAQAADDQFGQLAGRIRGQGEGVSGELVVTSLAHIASPLIPILARFQAAHPGLIVRLLTDERVFRLEYGEAHVAIRAGAAPDEPDNVVQKLLVEDFGLYASRGYVDAHGAPEDETDFAEHRFVGHDDAAMRAPFHRWLREAVPAARIAFRGTDALVLSDAIRQGVGIGFLPASQAQGMPDLVCIMRPREEWRVIVWLVTHVDLHRTAKVQHFVRFLRDQTAHWGAGAGPAATADDPRQAAAANGGAPTAR